MKKNIVVLVGGGGTEHEISLLSADYIESQIDRESFNVHRVLIDKKQKWTYQGLPINFTFDGELTMGNEKFKVDAAIPCIHGPPGETGEVQAFLELLKIPFLGCRSEASILSFNKLATKLLLENAGIKTAPFVQLQKEDGLSKLEAFFSEHQDIYLKATNQGSSVGCYHITDKGQISANLEEAFTYSPYVIAEKTIVGRELEVAVFEYQNKWTATIPGEIDCPSEFYSYEEKYSEKSETKTLVEAPNVSPENQNKMKEMALAAVETLKLRHLARIDFFLADDGEIYINEINTFPGHTKISMFPMMMENSGVKYFDYLNSTLNSLT
ncbi:MAG: D-alanine--D-alanine ligase [Bdellovibrionota bacterium]|nr:D-alanine--D-alanine ligase [Bdellovibrionota bacterium]